MIIKAVITYSDAIEATFTGNPLDLTQIPLLSPNQQYVQPANDTSEAPPAPTADTSVTAQAATDAAQTTDTTQTVNTNG